MANITLNFTEAFIERLRSYAERHRMKRNAVVKQAFELLEDQEGKVTEVPVKRDHRGDETW